MNEDRSLDQYFHARAAGIDLPPREAATIAARARQRRHARRSMVVFGTAALVLIAMVAVVAGGSNSRSVDVASNTGGPAAPLTWSVVDVPAGLGWSAGTVATEDGSLYGLSTAPGPSDPNAKYAPPVLYRSSEGKTWSTATLPDGLSATALATAGGNLYAVGTAAAGGGTDLVVATSTDGASTWSTSHIPTPRADLVARFGRQIQVSAPSLTTGPKGLIAAVTVTARPDVEPLLAARGDSGKSLFISATGVDVYKTDDAANAQRCGAGVAKVTGTGTVVSGTGTADSPSTTVPTADTVPTGTVPNANCVGSNSKVDHSYTWQELGLDPALQGLVGGEVHVYGSTDGVTFDEVGHPDGSIGTVGALIGGADGYRLMASDPLDSTLRSFWSADGRTWTSGGPDRDGMVQSSGLLAGTPAAVVLSQGATVLLVAAPGGGWTSSDLLTAAGSPNPSSAGLSSTSIGPLGLVALFYDGGVDNDPYVVDSADGHTFEHHRLSEIDGGGDWSPVGTSVSADAVTLRLVRTPKQGEDLVKYAGPQRLVVGTRS